MNTTELLAYWITEREAMRVRREGHHDGYAIVPINGEGYKFGYSDDPAMGTVRYCNVRREDDKVTRWLAKHWRPNHHSAWELVLARMVNYTPTLEQILIGWEQHPDEDPIVRAGSDMKVERDNGKKIWTSAYTISTCGKSMDKVDYVMGVVAAVQAQEAKAVDVPFWDRGLAHVHEWLTRVDGLGSFLAGQVVADMKNTKGHPLADATDWYDWSAPGPGSLKGLAAYFQLPVITARTYQKDIARCWVQVVPLLPYHLRDLHMQDFQNCLCEFSKFMRVRGGGHARNRYPGR